MAKQRALYGCAMAPVAFLMRAKIATRLSAD